ncbi:MAG: hypothetical protein RMY28_031440 [Nostoc sp. ChiSLP01]|nr:hypothetical protein [Nostoc sp. CmiSLP01]MDZ8283309.1 hypothetical protein [Nostoc sp. ChiSLP01]
MKDNALCSSRLCQIAIAISFKQLAENHPDAELEIVAMEKQGQDKFLLDAKTAMAADKS